MAVAKPVVVLTMPRFSAVMWRIRSMKFSRGSYIAIATRLSVPGSWSS